MESGLKFSGAAYEAKYDEIRLTGQIGRVFRAMKDSKYRTLDEIADRIYEMSGKRDGAASISAQLRNLRKDSFGSHTLNRRTRGERKSGLWEYQIIINVPVQDGFLF